MVWKIEIVFEERHVGWMKDFICVVIYLHLLIQLNAVNSWHLNTEQLFPSGNIGLGSCEPLGHIFYQAINI